MGILAIARLELETDNSALDPRVALVDDNEQTNEHNINLINNATPSYGVPSRTVSFSQNEHVAVASKPMARLAFVTVFCNICFSARAGILIAGSYLIEYWYANFAYFFFSELIPIGLMMFVLTR